MLKLNAITKSFFRLSIGALISISFSIHSAPVTKGYVMPAPNIFWKDTVFNGQGNEIQQKTAANNPDVFCQTQGKGYRLPAAGEYNSSQNSFLPYATTTPVTPGHWATYQNNDILQARKPNDATRKVTGSLYNEWGSLSTYENGWETSVSDRYWVTEPQQFYDTDISNRDYRLGRFAFLIATGTFSSTSGSKHSPKLVPEADNYVACVRDLVPIPV